MLFCDIHSRDELVLLIDPGAEVDRDDHVDEVDLLKRFVQGVKEHPWSAHWHEPTGFITELDQGKQVRTHRKSLPL